MGIFSKLNKKADDGPEIDDVEAWLAGDDDKAEHNNRSTDGAPSEDRGDGPVDVAAALGGIPDNPVPLTASEMIASAPPADLMDDPAPATDAAPMWNMPELETEPDVQWDVPVAETPEEPSAPAASSGMTTADLAAMVASTADTPTAPEMPPLPDIAVPDMGVPEIDVPEIDVPEIDVPEMELPEIDIPETELPEIDVPEMELPEIDVPETELPEMELPEIDIPETELPEVAGLELPDVDEELASSMPPPPSGEMLAPAWSTEANLAPTGADDLELVDAPDLAAPDLDAPDFETPDFDPPSFETPDFDPPSFETPDFDPPAEESAADVTAELPAIDLDDAPEDAPASEAAETIELTDTVDGPPALTLMPEGEQAEVLLEILGLQAGATWPEARQARADLIEQHDPDNESDADRADLARAIRREMNTAYAALRLLQVP